MLCLYTPFTGLGLSWWGPHGPVDWMKAPWSPHSSYWILDWDSGHRAESISLLPPALGGFSLLAGRNTAWVHRLWTAIGPKFCSPTRHGTNPTLCQVFPWTPDGRLLSMRWTVVSSCSCEWSCGWRPTDGSFSSSPCDSIAISSNIAGRWSDLSFTWRIYRDNSAVPHPASWVH